MSLTVSAFSSALFGMRAALARMDRAAGVISRCGLEPAPPPPGTDPPPPPAPGNGPAPDARAEQDLPGAMIDMLIAQRAFSAQLRVIETADAMSREVTNLGSRRR